MTIGERIQKLRKASNMTQSQFAKKLSVTDKSVSKWESEDGIPEINMMNTIADFFGTSLDFLMKGNSVSAGDKKILLLIEEYEAKENKKGSNIEVIKNCKRILKENGIEPIDAYLPKFNVDKAELENAGVFDSKDLTKFNLLVLLENGLTKIALKYFAEQITYQNAILCDDVDVYVEAKINYELARTEKINEFQKLQSGAYGVYHRDKRVTDKIYGYTTMSGYNNGHVEVYNENWALENLNHNLQKYYELIVWLIDNGAMYYLEYIDSYDIGTSINYICDKAKTNFIYRVAKDMVKVK